MAYSLSPWLKPRFFITGTNRPLAGGLMYTYKAGTTDPATTYSDDAGTENTNPIQLDSDGQCDLYLDDSVIYRIILKNAAGVTQFDKDRVASIGSNLVQSFNSIAALRLRIGTTIANAAKTLGYYAAGDGGGNAFYWDSTSTATDNSATIIKPTSVSGAGRWLAVNPNNINVRQFGAKTDGTDTTEHFQAAINFAETNGFVVNVPKGNYTIATTVTLKEGVSLIGERANPYNAAANYPSIIYHFPTSANTNVFELETFATYVSYVSCGAVENLFIVASPVGYTKYGFYLQYPVGARFKNIGASKAFTDGFLAIKGSVNCVFSDFRVANTTSYPMAAVVSMLSYNGEEYSTTTIFDNFYASGTLTAGTGGLTSAFLALPAAGVGIVVKHWILESITGVAFDIHKGNEVQIIAPYIENVPNANVATAVIEIGVTGAAAPNNAYDTITSLTVSGQGAKMQLYTQGAATNTVFIKADVAQYIIVKDLQLSQCIKFISGTANTQRLKISNIQATSVTTFQTGMIPYTIEEEGGCLFSTYVAGSINYEFDATKNTMPKALLKNAGLFISTDVGTEGALSWLDRADNQFNYTAIKYAVRPGNGVWRIGDVVVNSAPAIGGAMGWAATASGYGDAANWIIRGQLGIASGPTGSRPTHSTMGVPTDAGWAGTQYLDTTLSANGRLITWTGTMWVDYNGTSV